MQIKINIKKSHLFMLIAFVLVSFGIGYVVAYGGTLPPYQLGHTWNETKLPEPGNAWTGLHPDLTTLTCQTVSSGTVTGGNAFAACASGYTLTGGGCNNLDGCLIWKSMPSPNTNSWNCTMQGSCGTLRVAAYALCCK